MSGPPVFNDSDFVVAPPPTGQSQVGGLTSSGQQGAEAPLSYMLKSLHKGAAEGLGQDIESRVPIQLLGVAGIPESLLRQFLPRELVDKVFPIAKVVDPKVIVTDPITGKKTESTYRKVFLNKELPTSPESLSNLEGMYPYLSGMPRGKAPGDLSEMVGGGLEALGHTVTNPLGAPAKLGRAVLMAFGAGVGSEEGKKVFGSLGEAEGTLWDRWWGTKGMGQWGREAGELSGSIAGGAGGAQANVIRGKAISTAQEALNNAMKLRKEEAQASLVKNFKDNYSAMSAESKEIIQEHVNERIAATLQKNPATAENLTQFDEAAKRIKMDPATFDLAQRTADPALLVAAKSQVAQNLEEAQRWATQDQARLKGIVGAYENATGSTVGAKDVVEAMEDARKSANARIIAIEGERKTAQDTLTHLTPEERKAQGEGLKAAYDVKKQEVTPIRDGWYNAAKSADALDPKTYDFKGVKKDVGEILDTTLARMDKSTVPESFVKLKALLARAEGKPAVTTRVEKKPGLFATETVPGEEAKPITYADVEDITKALNREVPRDATEARNLALIQGSVYKAFSEQASPDLKAAFDTAQKNYRTLYAPMFKEGANFNLDRQAGIGRKGENFYAPDQGLKPYLDEKELITRMENFRNLFGGAKLGKRDERAFQELGRAIEDQYHREMFGPGKKYSQALHDQFMERWGPVFKEVPESKGKIEQAGARVLETMGQQAAEQQRFREAIRSPLNQALGIPEADKFVAKGLADPKQMARLIKIMEPHGGVEALMKDVAGRFNIVQEGKFDPDKMIDALTHAGPGLQVLFEKGLGGRVAAQEHLQTLKDIALVAKRTALTAENRQLAPTDRLSTNPIQIATGSGGASWMSYFRSTSQGYTSVPYVGVLAGGRFLNQTLQNQLRGAEVKAFTDPDMAKAVLEMYSKKMGETVSDRTLKTLFGRGSGLAMDVSRGVMEWFMDRGYITQTMTKGAQLGLSAYAEEKQKQEDRKAP